MWYTDLSFLQILLHNYKRKYLALSIAHLFLSNPPIWMRHGVGEHQFMLGELATYRFSLLRELTTLQLEAGYVGSHCTAAGGLQGLVPKVPKPPGVMKSVRKLLCLGQERGNTE